MGRQERQWAQVEAVFDLVAEAYASVPFFPPFGAALVEWADPAPGARLLDLGSGRGAVLEPASRAVGSEGSAIGVDFAAAMLAALRRDLGAAANVVLVRMDVERLAFDGASFDVVLAGLSLHILAEPRRAIAEAWRVLRPGGTFAFSIPGSPGSGRLAGYDALRERYRARIDTERWSMAPPPDLVAVAAETGFTSVETTLHHVHLPIESPEAFWEMELSHGMRGWVDALGPEARVDFEREALAVLREIHARGELAFDRGARLVRCVRPG